MSHRPETVTPTAELQDTPTNPALLALQGAQTVLLLQGPVGPFFDRLTHWLQQQGKQVERVVFQGGDQHDCQALQPIAYTGSPEAWQAFFYRLVRKLQPDCVVLFGQARHYHRVAIQAAQAQGVAVVVLEEGYFRPGYITMELDGVNGYSTTLDKYLWNPSAPGPKLNVAEPDSTEGQFWQMARYAMRHYWAMHQSRSAFQHYQHHKGTSVLQHSRYWLRSWLIKHLHLQRDNARVHALATQDYFFVPLQHDGDPQITDHSPFEENTEFIITVLRSFAHHSPPSSHLVFRQHPHSRGGTGHARLIRALAKELHVSDRVTHLVEGHTPTLVKHARGVVVINSTVGLQALVHRKPLAALGEALYKQPGVTHNGALKNFWTACPLPNEVQLCALLDQIRHLTQAPCNVYGLRNEPLYWHPVSEEGTRS